MRQYATSHKALKPESGWVVLSSEEDAIKTKIERKGTPLKDWDINIYRGILTGFNDAFIITEEVKDKLLSASPKNAEIIRPILKGRSISKYSTETTQFWLINSHNGLKSTGLPRINVEKDYPTIFTHFNQYKKQLMLRQDKGDTWCNLRNCAYLKEFDKEKIVWLELTDAPKFAYDESKIMVEATGFILTGKRLKYLTAFLNSKVSGWYFDKITTTSGVGTNRWKKVYIEALPIPIPSAADEKRINALLDCIIADKRKGLDTTNAERQIDIEIYSLFGISSNEIELLNR